MSIFTRISSVVLLSILSFTGHANAALVKEAFSVTGTNVVETFFNVPTGNVVPDFNFAFTITFDPGSSLDNGSLPLEAVTLDSLSLPGVVGIPPSNDFKYTYSNHELDVSSTNDVFNVSILSANTLIPTLKEVSYSAAPVPYFYDSKTGTVNANSLGTLSPVPIPTGIILFITAIGIVAITASYRHYFGRSVLYLRNRCEYDPRSTLP